MSATEKSPAAEKEDHIVRALRLHLAGREGRVYFKAKQLADGESFSAKEVGQHLEAAADRLGIEIHNWKESSSGTALYYVESDALGRPVVKDDTPDEEESSVIGTPTYRWCNLSALGRQVLAAVGDLSSEGRAPCGVEVKSEVERYCATSETATYRQLSRLGRDGLLEVDRTAPGPSNGYRLTAVGADTLRAGRDHLTHALRAVEQEDGR